MSDGPNGGADHGLMQVVDLGFGPDELVMGFDVAAQCAILSPSHIHFLEFR